MHAVVDLSRPQRLFTERVQIAMLLDMQVIGSVFSTIHA